MKPHPGVYRRPSANRWQFQLQVPTDLRTVFPSQWACRLSLGTADLAEANAKAKALHAEWQSKFDQLRGKPAVALRMPLPRPAPAPVQLTSQLIQQAGNLTYQRMLESDETARMAGLSHARYIDDANVAADNNRIENLIRPIALGRKNWLFAGSLRAGQRAAAIMSLLHTARLNGHDPYADLRDVLERLPTQRASALRELLPYRWTPAG